MENDIQRIEQSHVGVYGVVFDEPKEKVLLILKGRGPYKGMYDLPGGSIEEGETNEEALVREFQEEIGVELESFTFLYQDLYEFEYKSQTRGLIDFRHTAYFYKVQIPHNTQIKTEPDGHDSMGAIYISIEQVLSGEISVTPMAKKVIESLV